jgi:hypothetical protein
MSGARGSTRVASVTRPSADVYPRTPALITSTSGRPRVAATLRISSGYEVWVETLKGPSRNTPKVVESPRQAIRTIPRGFGVAGSGPRNPRRPIRTGGSMPS